MSTLLAAHSMVAADPVPHDLWTIDPKPLPAASILTLVDLFQDAADRLQISRLMTCVTKVELHRRLRQRLVLPLLLQIMGAGAEICFSLFSV